MANSIDGYLMTYMTTFDYTHSLISQFSFLAQTCLVENNVLAVLNVPSSFQLSQVLLWYQFPCYNVGGST